MNLAGITSLETLGYRAATQARRSPHVLPVAGSADSHLRYDRDTLVRVSRGYARDNSIFQGIHRVAMDNILGSGFALQANTGDAELDVRVEALWKEYCRAPEVRGLFTWHQVERMALAGLLIAGDIGAIRLSSPQDPSLDGKLQIIEAEQIDAGRFKSPAGNRIEGGVELDRFGRAVWIYVRDYDATGTYPKGPARAYAAEDFQLLANRDRPSQTRGVPRLVACFPDIERLDDILSSEAAAWQILSRLALVRKQEGVSGLVQATSKPDDNRTPETEYVAKRVQDLQMALIFNCEPGESIEGVERNIPGANFEQSVRVFLRVLGLPLGLPLELILLDWSQTNYSSARAALEQAYVSFTAIQDQLASDWHTPTYLWQLERWIAQGFIDGRPEVRRHEWIKPQFPWIDPLAEGQAWGLKLDRGLTTHAEALKSVNRDRADWLVTREREVREAIELAQRLREETGEEVDWRIFAGLSARQPNVAKLGQETPTSPRAPKAEKAPKPEGIEYAVPE